MLPTMMGGDEQDEGFRMLDKAVVVEILRGAFRPLECVPQLIDYENGFGFRVYGSDGASLFEKPIMSTGRLLRGKDDLEQFIRHWRDRVEARGIHLEPWVMPVDASSEQPSD